MNELIKSADDLYETFFQVARHQPSKAKEVLTKGYYVKSKIVQEVLTGDSQGEISLEGWVYTMKFESLGAGVYRAYVEYRD